MNALNFAVPLLAASLPATEFPVASVEIGELRLAKKCAGWQQHCGENMPTTVSLQKGEAISFVTIKLEGDIFGYGSRIGAIGVHYRLQPCDSKKYNSYDLYPFAMMDQSNLQSGSYASVQKQTDIRIELPMNLRYLDIEKSGHGYKWMLQAISEKNVCIQINSGNTAGYYAEVKPINISEKIELKFE